MKKVEVQGGPLDISCIEEKREERRGKTKKYGNGDDF